MRVYTVLGGENEEESYLTILETDVSRAPLWMKVFLAPLLVHLIVIPVAWWEADSRIAMTVSTLGAAFASGCVLRWIRGNIATASLGAAWPASVFCLFGVYDKLDMYRPYGYAMNLVYDHGLPWLAGWALHSAVLAGTGSIGWAYVRFNEWLSARA